MVAEMPLPTLDLPASEVRPVLAACSQRPAGGTDRATAGFQAVAAILLVAPPFLYGCVEAWALSLLTFSVFAYSAVFLLFRRSSLSSPPFFSWAVWAVAALGFAQSFRVFSLLGDTPTGPATVSAWASERAAWAWAAAGMWYWSVSSLVRDKRDLRRFTSLVFWAVVLFAVVGVAQHSSESRAVYGLRPFDGYRNPFGPYFNKDNAASLLAVGLAAGAGLFLSRLYTRRPPRLGAETDFWAGQSVLLGGAALLAAGFWIASSSGAALSLLFPAVAVCAAAAEGFTAGRYRRRLLWGLGILAAAAAVAFLVGAGPFSFDTSFGGLSFEDRLAIWRDSVRLFHHRPLWGTGLGTFSFVFPVYQASLVRGIVEHAHSDFLELLVEAGRIGFFLTGAGVFVGFLRPALEWRAETDRETRCLAGGLLAGLLAILVHATADFPLAVPATSFLVVGIAAALKGFYDDHWPETRGSVEGVAKGPLILSLSKDDRSRAPQRWGIAAALLCLAAAARSLPPALAGGPLAGAKSSKSHEERAMFLERAHRLDPGNPVTARALASAYLWTADGSPSRGAEFAQKAEETALQALAATPDHAGLLYAAGASAARLGQAEEARNLVARSRRLEPWRIKK